MAEISVAVEETTAEGVTCGVKVAEGGSETTHRMTVARRELERLSKPDEPAEEFVRRCFEFLLAREPKESILGKFDLSVIGRYFPEFEQEMAR